MNDAKSNGPRPTIRVPSMEWWDFVVSAHADDRATAYRGWPMVMRRRMTKHTAPFFLSRSKMGCSAIGKRGARFLANTREIVRRMNVRALFARTTSTTFRARLFVGLAFGSPYHDRLGRYLDLVGSDGTLSERGQAFMKYAVETSAKEILTEFRRDLDPAYMPHFLPDNTPHPGAAGMFEKLMRHMSATEIVTAMTQIPERAAFFAELLRDAKARGAA